MQHTRILLRPNRLKLVGLLTTPDAPTDCLVLMAPGFCSDKSSKGRFDLHARSLVEQGIASLALDFRGTGESDDSPITLEGAAQDLRDAIRFVKKQGYTSLGMIGNSWGAAACF